MLDKEYIKQRSDHDKATGCYHWVGSVTKKKPVAYVGNSCVYVRSYVYVQKKGPIPRGFRVTMTCGNWDCIAPRHMTLSPLIAPRSAQNQRNEGG